MTSTPPLYTIFDEDGTIVATHKRAPEYVKKDGRIVFGVTEKDLPDYNYYPESYAPRQPYDDGYVDPPQRDTETRMAVFTSRDPGQSERRNRAMKQLLERLTAERERRVVIVTTGLELIDAEGYYSNDTVTKEQLAVMVQVDYIQQRQIEGIADAKDMATIDGLKSIPSDIASIDNALAAIRQWCIDTLVTITEIDAFNPMTPPNEAPQWPTH